MDDLPFSTLHCPCGCLQPDPKRMWCPTCLLELQEAYRDAYHMDRDVFEEAN